MMATKILFVNAIDYMRRVEISYPPLSFGYLASALRDAFGQSHFEFRVVDRDVENTIRLFTPDIVAITAASPNFNRAVAYAKIAKQYGLPVIMGGVHISALPSSLTGDMDVGIIGEGERTIVDLLHHFEDESGLHPDALNRVQGIVYKQDGTYVITPQRPPVTPLDQISMPARDLLTFPHMSIMTSRGCPYRCVFCSASCFWGGIRFFSPEYVVHELTHILENYQVPDNIIIIWDELFIADTQRLRDIVNLMEKNGLLGRFKFWCHARANLVTDEVAELLNQMGVRMVNMGLESDSPPILQYYKGPTVSIRDHGNAIRTLKRRGIVPEASFIIGAPQETHADFLRTIQFMKKFQLKSELYLLTPLPGTMVWDYALQKGLVSEEMDWGVLQTFRITGGDGSETERKNCWNNAVILSETLTRKEIFDLFYLFERERKWIIRKKNLKRALRHPTWAFHAYSNLVLERFAGKKDRPDGDPHK